MRFAKENGLFFMETSALTGNNVHRAFQILLQEIHSLNDRLGGLEGTGQGGYGAATTKRTVVLTGDAVPPEEEGCAC